MSLPSAFWRETSLYIHTRQVWSSSRSICVEYFVSGKVTGLKLGRGGGHHNHHWLIWLFFGSQRLGVSCSKNDGLSSILLTPYC